MRDWLTEEEDHREKRGTWKLKLEFGLFVLALALPVLATITGWIGD